MGGNIQVKATEWSVPRMEINDIMVRATSGQNQDIRSNDIPVRATEWSVLKMNSCNIVAQATTCSVP